MLVGRLFKWFQWIGNGKESILSEESADNVLSLCKISPFCLKNEIGIIFWKIAKIAHEVFPYHHCLLGCELYINHDVYIVWLPSDINIIWMSHRVCSWRSIHHPRLHYIHGMSQHGCYGSLQHQRQTQHKHRTQSLDRKSTLQRDIHKTPYRNGTLITTWNMNAKPGPGFMTLFSFRKNLP